MKKNKFFKLPKNCKIQIDKDVVIQDKIIIAPNCKSIKIGYGSFIGRDTF